MAKRRIFHATSTPLTLAPRDSDVVVIADVADLVINLPKAQRDARGNRVEVVVLTLSTGTGCSLNPYSADKIQGTGITAADNKDIINTAATDAVGDTLTIVCDGEDGWVITNKTGTWAREA